MSKSKFVVEKVTPIQPSDTLKDTLFDAQLIDQATGKLVVYNPDKWQQVSYTFFITKPETKKTCFEILNISR